MKTLLLLLTTLLFASINKSVAATILFDTQTIMKSPLISSTYAMKFHNIPENDSAEPFLVIIIEFDHFDSSNFGALQSVCREINHLCRQKGGIRNQKDHYDKLMPIVEAGCKRIKALEPSLIKLWFPRIQEKAILLPVK